MARHTTVNRHMLMRLVTFSVLALMSGLVFRPAVSLADGETRPKPWSRPYRAPGISLVQPSFELPLDRVRHHLLAELRDPLSHGKDLVRLQGTKKVTHDIPFVEELSPEVSFEMVGFPFPHPEVHVRPRFMNRVRQVIKESLVSSDLEITHRVILVPGSVSLSAAGNQLRVGMELEYQLDAMVKSGEIPVTPPGSANGRIHLEVARSLGWSGSKAVLTGGDTSVRLSPHQNFSLSPPFAPIDPGTILKINGILEIVKDRINDRVQDALSGQRVDVGEMVQGLAKPFDLGGFKLFVNAENITPWEFDSEGIVIRSGLTMSCRPGSCAEAIVPTRDLFEVARPAPRDLASRMEVDIVLRSAELARRLLPELRSSLGGRFEFGDPVVYADGDADSVDGPSALGRVLIEVPLRSPVLTTLSIRGILCLDGSTIRLKDARWKTQAFQNIGALSGSLVEKIHLDLSSTLGELTSKPIILPLDQGLLTVSVTKAEIGDVYVTAESEIRIVFLIDGKVKVDLQVHPAEARVYGEHIGQRLMVYPSQMSRERDSLQRNWEVDYHPWRFSSYVPPMH
jgi:hypothetical protein